MTGSPPWVPDGIDLEAPSAARVYDYLLGGGHNFQADRDTAEKIEQILPNATRVARSNRDFLRRAVRFMLDQGITQFLDLGSGIPTVGNVHEVAQRSDPNNRVVYVDYEGVAVAHSELMLSGNPYAAVVRADLREPDVVLGEPIVQRLLDFTRPIGLLMVAVFHFVSDDRDPARIIARYRDVAPKDSLIAISHLTADHDPVEMAAVIEAMRNTRDPMFFRPYDEVVALFDGMDLVEPGVVGAPLWRPDHGVSETTPVQGVYVGVGRKT